MNAVKLVGRRAHVFQKPYTREDHEGVAVIVSADLSRQDGDLIPCRVRFVDFADEPVVCRFVSEADLLPSDSFVAPWGGR